MLDERCDRVVKREHHVKGSSATCDIHVKSISSAHEPQVGLSCQAKTTKALLWFLSLTLRDLETKS